MRSEPLRVALISSSYHPHVGGVEEHVRQVARELMRKGHAVEVWTVDRGDGLRDERVEGIRVRYLATPLPAQSPRAVASFALRAPRALASWVGAQRDFRPDLLHVQCFGPNGVYGLALAALTGLPLVVSSHGETFGDEHGVFDRSVLLRVALRHAVQRAAVTGCSSLVAEDLIARFGAADVTVVPNGVDLEVPTSRQDVPLAAPNTTPTLLGIGRLVPQKGFDILLRAAARSAHAPAVRLIGEGAQRRELEDLASSLGITDRVNFLGRRSPEEIDAFIAAADAVVVPSRAEAFGIVVLEAWRSGAPVVATSKGGPATFVTDGLDGLLVDPDDLASVVEGIDRVLGSQTLASGLERAGAATVQAFTWSRVAADYLDVYTAARSRSSG